MRDYKVLCVTGIDTDIGKSIVTGLVARFLLHQGYRVITQKLCQTGCTGVSEDIVLHRKIMGVELTEDDANGLTCPYIFSEPCSPHLAASLEQAVIDPTYITACTRKLGENYDIVVLEGVGGLMVPLTSQMTLVDYLRELDYRHILVSSGQLGSINHTLSALEIFKSRKMQLLGVAYNLFAETSDVITADTRRIIKKYLGIYGFTDSIVDIKPYQEDYTGEDLDFSEIMSNFE